jgi:hypothetical protein
LRAAPCAGCRPDQNSTTPGELHRDPDAGLWEDGIENVPS